MTIIIKNNGLRNVYFSTISRSLSFPHDVSCCHPPSAMLLPPSLGITWCNPLPPWQRAGAGPYRRAGFLPNFRSNSLKVEGMLYFYQNPTHVLRPPATSPFTRAGIRLVTCQISPFFSSKMRYQCLAAQPQLVLFLPWRFLFSLAPPLLQPAQCLSSRRDKPGCGRSGVIPGSPIAGRAPRRAGPHSPNGASLRCRSSCPSPSGFKASKILGTAGCF